MVRIHPGQPHTKGPIERSGLFCCQRSTLAESNHGATAIQRPNPFQTIPGQHRARLHADPASDTRRAPESINGAPCTLGSGTAMRNEAHPAAARLMRPVSGAASIQPAQPPPPTSNRMIQPGCVTDGERARASQAPKRQKPGNAGLLQRLPRRTSAMRTRWISAWRTGSRGGPCAGRPSYAQLHGRRGS
ncbi:hypothetical protein XBLMG947_2061 [Xanthomonas bromi]|uniref:Uncharacterized protein n=1 Tax=Xanthomonas bromi TaxID=56449 RepID=A0A1C3NLT8_9XANT|nr:hypothetical protein XBLMG947_2061 [Xanthomonas bromi]